MINLSITPAKLEVQLKPGANYVQSYIIKNSGDQSVTLTSLLNSWIPQGTDGNVTYLNLSPDFDITLSNTDLKLGQPFILDPNQSRQLVLKIQVPPDATSGDRYFTFFVNQEISSNLSTNSTQLIRLGSHLLISVTNAELPISKFTVSNLKTNSPFIDCFFSSVQFSGQINNQSNYFDKINNTISISKSNAKVTELPIFPDNVLANHSRQFRCLDKNLPVECKLSNPLWPGIYQATIGDTATSFIVLPYSLLTFFLIIGVIAKILVDKNKHRQL